MRIRFFGQDILAAVRPFRLLLATLVIAAGFAGMQAQAGTPSTPAEQFIADNVQKGLIILNNKTLTKDLRRAQFRDFLLGLVDVKVIADYTLGQYRRTATPADIGAFDDAFKDYAFAVYQVYFNKFSGQTLQVTGSYQLAADESVVKSIMVDPTKSNEAKPLRVDFRVAAVHGHLAVIDFAVEGVWLRETERSDFTSYLGQNSGNIALLTSSLRTKTQGMH